MAKKRVFEHPTIRIRNTRFQFYTNFAGDPEVDAFGSTAKQGNVIITDSKLVKELKKEGFNVKETKPGRDDDPDSFKPEHFIKIQAGYKGWSTPSIYLFDIHGKPTRLNEKTLVIIDKLVRKRQVDSVDVVLNKWQSDPSKPPTLWIESMKVVQKESTDPYLEEAEAYWNSHKESAAPDENAFDAFDEEDVPF